MRYLCSYIHGGIHNNTSQNVILQCFLMGGLPSGCQVQLQEDSNRFCQETQCSGLPARCLHWESKALLWSPQTGQRGMCSLRTWLSNVCLCSLPLYLKVDKVYLFMHFHVSYLWCYIYLKWISARVCVGAWCRCSYLTQCLSANLKKTLTLSEFTCHITYCSGNNSWILTKRIWHIKIAVIYEWVQYDADPNKKICI